MSSYSNFDYAYDRNAETIVNKADAYDFFEHVAKQNKRDEDNRVEYGTSKAIQQIGLLHNSDLVLT